MNVGTLATTLVNANGTSTTTLSSATMSALSVLVGASDVTSLIFTGTGTFTVDAAPTFTIGDMTVNSGVTLTASAYSSATASGDDYGLSPVSPFQQGNGRLILNLTGTFTNNGTVTMAGKGYSGGASFQAGYSHGGYNAGGAGRLVTAGRTYASGCPTPYAGAGGSYGTVGGAGGQVVGSTFGANDFHTALYLGSGGSGAQPLGGCGGSYPGGAGGGAISVSAANITNAGTITVAGGNGVTYGGGGSGGTIYLNATSALSNTGTITTAGGTGSNGAGSGGTGRVKLSGSSVTVGTCTGEGPTGTGCAQ